LWKEMHRVIDIVRPDFALVENSSALTSRGLGTVLGDLASIGYDAEWNCFRASAIGAPHGRDRIWIVAYPVGTRGARLEPSADIGQAGPWRLRGETDLQRIANAPFERGDRWPQPLLRRMDDGLSSRVDRLRAVGNAQVPQVVELIARAILQTEAA
jgi:DNA (cytosine-5)-methyltransferase 1